MGTDKSMLFYEGEQLLDKFIRLATAVSDDVLVAGNNAPQIPGARFIPDETKDKGPLSGIQTALANSRHEWVLTLPCDLILLSSDFLSWMKESLKSLSSERAAFVAAERDHFLVGFYHRSILTEVTQLIADNDLRVRQLTANTLSKRLTAPTSLELDLTNFNDVADLEKHGFMKITLLAFGQIEEIIGFARLNWITRVKDIRSLRHELTTFFPTLKKISFSLALNETIVDQSELKMEDTIAILPPFAGG